MANYPAGPVPRPLQLVNAVITLPFVVLHTSLRLAFQTLVFGATVVGAVASRVLPQCLTAPMRSAVRAIAQGPAEQPPATAAASFIQSFSAKYGERAPRWQVCGWQEAATRAQNEGKFLFVYIHSARHQDAAAFCANTLCAPAFVDYLNATFLAWGGDLRSSDAFRLASSLRAAVYPYCALLAFSGTRTQRITCIEGAIGPEALAEVLQAALSEHGGILWQDRAQREQRETDRRLREEQDAEYQRSLEADRERERQAEAARAAAREAEEKRLQAERAAAEAAAQEAEKQAEAEAALERRRVEKRRTLPEEPEAGVEGVALIRVRLPSGATHQRRFMGSDALQVVMDWVDALDSHDHMTYSLATTYPRKVFRGPEDLQKTLNEHELAPHSVLLVQPEE